LVENPSTNYKILEKRVKLKNNPVKQIPSCSKKSHKPAECSMNNTKF